jgi:hypothetical protein
MWIGDVVAERFLVERPIGSGGMGSVFLATDRADGRAVAIKVLELSSDGAVERFRREARVLSELSHPGIVRYVAHGETAERQPFLAMELLEGEDLTARLARGAFSAEDAVAFVRRAAEALAFAHSRGIVHRDVKPSNLFLVGGDVERVKVLDFGIARTHLQTQGLTQTGAMLGTVGYMAPEQAMGSRDVDARADVFALGCVLFECLTGKPAFAGEHVVAILAKVLAEEAPRVSELAPEVGTAFDSLVARLLSKKPEERPVDASAVLRELEALGGRARASAAPAASSSAHSLGHAEQRVATVILAEPAGGVAMQPTVTPDEFIDETEAARAVAARFGAELHPLPGGALVFVLAGKGAASDLAMRAASVALAVVRALPALRLAVATGRAQTTGRLPVGDAIDRAASLLREPSAPSGGPLLDEVTLSLVGARCIVREQGAFRVLVGAALGAERPRLLMGKPTPTVGRDKELALLEATLTECVDDSVARVVLITAPPGTGKSRLGGEVLMRARAREGQRALSARADEMGSGSSYAVMSRLVRSAAGIDEGVPTSNARVSLRAYLRSLLEPEDVDRVAEFLGEVIGAPVGTPSPALRTARDDPRTMTEETRLALESWLDAEIRRGPLLVLLDDLHWGDHATVELLGAALRRHEHRAIFLLALARPGVHQEFPKLWGGVGGNLELQEIALAGLTRRAAEGLARAALGKDVSQETVARIVELADGNAFYLEELIRTAASGEVVFPGSVVAMAEARLTELDPEARRAARAASVFGEMSWAGGVTALLGHAGLVAIDELLARELLVASPESRFAGDAQYMFRHALLRDAAYAMLTEEDRMAAHRLAAEWLEQAGEQNPLVLAEHWERSDESARSARWFLDAVEHGVTPRDWRGLLERAELAGAAGDDRARLLGLRAYFLIAQGRSQEIVHAASEALDVLPAGSDLWFRAVGALIFAAMNVGDAARTERASTALLAAKFPPTAACAWAGYTSGLLFLMTGSVQLARRIGGLLDSAAESPREPSPAFSGWYECWKSAESLFLHDDPSGALHHARRMAIAFQESREASGEIFPQVRALSAFVRLGRIHEAEQAFNAAIAFADRWRHRMIKGWHAPELMLAMADAGRVEDAERVAAEVTDTFDFIAALGTRSGLARCYFVAGRLEDAERRGREVEDLGVLPWFQCWAQAELARIAVARGTPAEALRRVARSREIAAHNGMCSLYESNIRVASAEAHHALGNKETAHAEIREARDRILRIAATIEPEHRASYTTIIEPNRRTLELAREWLRES